MWRGRRPGHQGPHVHTCLRQPRNKPMLIHVKPDSLVGRFQPTQQTTEDGSWFRTEGHTFDLVLAGKRQWMHLGHACRQHIHWVLSYQDARKILIITDWTKSLSFWTLAFSSRDIFILFSSQWNSWWVMRQRPCWNAWPVASPPIGGNLTPGHTAMSRVGSPSLHRRGLPFLSYPINMVIYHYHLIGVIYMVTFDNKNVQNYHINYPNKMVMVNYHISRVTDKRYYPSM